MTSLSFRRTGATAGLLAAVLAAGGCRSSNHRPAVGAVEEAAVAANDASAFAVGVTPTAAPPVTVGTPVGFRVSSSGTGFGHLYLFNTDGGVTMLAENLPVAAGAQVEYPRPGDGITIRATPPLGVDRVTPLVTRQPSVGFAGNQGSTLTRPVALASTAEAFLRDFNEATGCLPASSSWAVAETRVQVVERAGVPGRTGGENGLMERHFAFTGGALVLAAALAAADGARAQDARNLTVEQTAFDAVQAPAAPGAANPLGVVAWVDHPDNTYGCGERVRLFVQTNKDAWVTVLNVGPDGAVTVLFPNRHQSDNRVRANMVTEVPDPAARARIEVRGAMGALIKVIASSRPVPSFDAAQLAAAGLFQTLRIGADETARNRSVAIDAGGAGGVGRLRQGHPHRAASAGGGVADRGPGGGDGVAVAAVRARDRGRPAAVRDDRRRGST